MKKLIGLFMAVCSFAICLLLTSCGGNQYMLTVEGSVYKTCSQTLTATIEEGSFSSSIKASDIELGSDFGSGKKVTEVKYVSDKEITITIDGDLGKSFESYTYYKISVTGGMNGDKAEGVVTVWGCAPYISCYGINSYGTHKESKFGLCYGSFNADYCNTTYITLKDSDGDLDVSIEGKYLTISVDNSTTAKVYVTISAECTTFNKAVTVGIGVISEYYFE